MPGIAVLAYTDVPRWISEGHRCPNAAHNSRPGSFLGRIPAIEPVRAYIPKLADISLPFLSQFQGLIELRLRCFDLRYQVTHDPPHVPVVKQFVELHVQRYEYFGIPFEADLGGAVVGDGQAA